MSLPERLGRLQRVRRIGVGGFASVWLYRDDELDSFVAVKALADNWSQRLDIRQRFLEEARILRRADSDHVVRVYDIGETEDQTPYFVMTYADMGTVADLVSQAPLPVEHVCALVNDAAAGLAVLHRRGVVHRDVKPANLLLATSEGGPDRLMVADLGVAKALLHASGITQVVGTPAYMAPEQAQPGEGVDPRADLHGLGAVAYHLLTGRFAREGGISSLIDPQLPPPPSSLAPLPMGVDAVLFRALSIDPEDRWPDVQTFARELTRVVEYARSQPETVFTPAPAGAGSTPPTPRTTVAPAPVPAPVPALVPALADGSGASNATAVRRRVTRSGRGWLLGGVAVAVVVVAATAGGLWWTNRSPGSAPSPAPTTATTGTPPSTNLAVPMPAGWFSSVETARTVSYRSSAGSLLTVTRQPSKVAPRQAATRELTRLRDAELVQFHQVWSRSLSPDQLGPWTTGWAIDYSYLFGNARPREAVEWWVSYGYGSTGTILFASDPNRAQHRDDLLKKAAVALARAH
ncbi:MAG: serine/threonine-protein kinase [Nocardioidaceae bacterium]